MNIYSKFLKREVEVDVKSIDDTNSDMKIISHDSLRELFLSGELGAGISYQYSPIFMNGSHYAVLCTMKISGREVQEVGESLPATLTNPISKNYPILIAYQRAFDRALIAFLGFSGKVLSDTEMGMEDYTPKDITIPTIQDDSAIAEYEKKKEEKVDTSSESKPDKEPVVEEYMQDEETVITPSIITEELEDEEPIFDEEEVNMETSEENKDSVYYKVTHGAKWNRKFYNKNGGFSIYLDGSKVDITKEEKDMLDIYISKNPK